MLNSQTNTAATNAKEFKSFKGLKEERIEDVDERASLEEDRGSRVIRRNSRGRPKPFEEIEVQSKERGRSSELGISNKYHRRLQTTDVVDPTKKVLEQEHAVLSDPEQDHRQQYPQERRARSSLSNRNHSAKVTDDRDQLGHNILSPNMAHQSVKGPAVSSAITNTSQLMNTGQLDIMQMQGVNIGLNSSQPIILNQSHNQNLDLNSNLR